MQRIASLRTVRTVLAVLAVAVFAAFPALAASAAPASASEPIAAGDGSRACAAAVAIERMSAAELELWMAEAGVEPMTPAAAEGGTTDPPQCPKRRSCDPCGEGNGPCFLTPFGSDSCCTSPSGPCFQCPKGTTIQVSSCPCFGDLGEGLGRCPARDQDWFCG